MEDNLNQNGRRPQPKWKTTSPKMEDDLTQNGRRPKWKTTKMDLVSITHYYLDKNLLFSAPCTTLFEPVYVLYKGTGKTNNFHYLVVHCTNVPGDKTLILSIFIVSLPL